MDDNQINKQKSRIYHDAEDLLLVAGFPNHMNCPESHGGRGFQNSAPKTVKVDGFGGESEEEPSI